MEVESESTQTNKFIWRSKNAVMDNIVLWT